MSNSRLKIIAGVPGKIINRNVDKFKEEKLI